jgi:23S rRNA (guanosine2251-2'-O)-methyltransferase
MGYARGDKRTHLRAVVLDNLRSAYNAGSIIRTVSALNYDSVALCGVTITPPSDKLKKTSRCLDEKVNWTYYKTTEEAVLKYREENYKVFALEVMDGSMLITDLPKTEKIAWVVGNEALGIDQNILKLCDAVYHLPMLNNLEGINVSCAFSSVAFFEHLKYST